MLDEWLDRLEQAPDEYEQLRLVSTLGEYPEGERAGRSEGRTGRRRAHDIDAVRDRLKAVRELGAELAGAVTEQTCARLAWEIAQFTLERPTSASRAGRLEFHDLLVLARAVLRDPEHGWQVRSYLRERYTHLLLDEFQDTDPIQCDLAALLASADPDAATRPWDEITVDPGRLFVVGDPKQSIYRFRRADIAAFLRARDAFGAAPSTSPATSAPWRRSSSS